MRPLSWRCPSGLALSFRDKRASNPLPFPMHLISCSLALRVGMSNSRSSDGHRDTRSDTLTPGSSSLRASSLLVRPWEWRGASQPRLLCSSLYEEKGSISSVRVRGGRRRIGTPITLSDQIPFSTVCEPVRPLTYWQVLQQGHQDVDAHQLQLAHKVRHQAGQLRQLLLNFLRALREEVSILWTCTLQRMAVQLVSSVPW